MPSDELVKVGGAFLTVALVTSVVSSRQSAKAIEAMGDAFSGSIRAALGTDYSPTPEHEETLQEWISRVEHELMIEGHQSDCVECQRKPTLRERWLRGNR